MTDAKPFPSYKHSGQKLSNDGTIDGCCDNCWPSQCTSNFVASFDLDGSILVPSGNPVRDPELLSNWANTSPPGEVHPIPCAYKVTISNIGNMSTSESWCQHCTDLNSTYYMRLPREVEGNLSSYSHIGDNYSTNNFKCFGWDTFSVWEHIQMLGRFELCNSQHPISMCGFNEVVIYLVIGQNRGFKEWWKPFNESSVAPYDDDDYIYRNKNRETEGRPQLHLYAIAHFIKPRWGTSPDPDIQLDGYVFQTKIDDFNGDYKYKKKHTGIIPQGTYGIKPFDDTYYNSTKTYHGDIDGRNLTFTINGTDRIDVMGSASNEFNMICSMDSMTIKVEPAEDTLRNTVDSTRSFRGFVCADTWTDFLSEVIFYNNRLFSDVLSKYDAWGQGALGHDWITNTNTDSFSYSAAAHGVVPEVAYVTIDGTVSTNADNEDKYVCNDAEDLNGQHALKLLAYREQKNAGLYVTYFVCFDKYSPTWYKGLDTPLCCKCNTENNACISALRLGVTRGKDGVTIKLLIFGNGIRLAQYEVEFRDKQYPNGITVDDVDGAKLTKIYTNELYSEQVTFGPSVTINMDGSPDSCDCLTNRECINCITGTYSDEILLEPEDNELELVPKGETSYSCGECEDPTGGLCWGSAFKQQGVGEDAVLNIAGAGSWEDAGSYRTASCKWEYSFPLISYPDYNVSYSATYRLEIDKYIDEYIYKYTGSWTKVVYENEWVITLYVDIMSHEYKGWWITSVYQTTVPIVKSTIDLRGEWLDCNFYKLDLPFLTWTASVWNPGPCYPKIGNSVTITAQW